MRLVYLAGPYRAATVWGTHQNIQTALRIGAEIVAKFPGWYPVIPHANTAYMDGVARDQYFLDGAMELMRRCDAVLVMPGWASSKGSIAEIAEAERLGLPVAYWHDHFNVNDLEEDE